MINLTEWGKLPTGKTVQQATLADGSGLEVKVASYGATLTSILVPDRLGRINDVLLGFDSLDDYLAVGFQGQWPYFGSTIGRYANRIAGARFTIDEQEYHLTNNEGPNQNHGGSCGFDRASWQMERMTARNGVHLSYCSMDGEEGFPGTLLATTEIMLDGPGEIVIRYRATTDRATHVSMASHGYFNLAGRAARSIADHDLSIAATHMLPIDVAALPTGAIRSVLGTPFDLRQPVRLGSTLAADDPQLLIGGGLNHCFALDAGTLVSARLHHAGSGRTMTLSTTAPGLQVYSSNAFDGTITDAAGRPFVRHQAIALEAQHFPDSPNQPHFPPTLLRPGEMYESTTRLRFFIA